MIEYTLNLLYMIGIVIFVSFIIILYIFGRKETNIIEDIIGIGAGVILLGLAIIMIISYPYQTIPYQNGYHDYPDNSTYNTAKILSTQYNTVSEYTWYCQGYEAAKYDDRLHNKTIITNETKQFTSKNITRHEGIIYD